MLLVNGFFCKLLLDVPHFKYFHLFSLHAGFSVWLKDTQHVGRGAVALLFLYCLCAELLLTKLQSADCNGDDGEISFCATASLIVTPDTSADSVGEILKRKSPRGASAALNRPPVMNMDYRNNMLRTSLQRQPVIEPHS